MGYFFFPFPFHLLFHFSSLSFWLLLLPFHLLSFPGLASTMMLVAVVRVFWLVVWCQWSAAVSASLVAEAAGNSAARFPWRGRRRSSW